MWVEGVGLGRERGRMHASQLGTGAGTIKERDRFLFSWAMHSADNV